MGDPAIMQRDINVQWQEFIETITIVYQTATVIDPYSSMAIKSILHSFVIPVSWHDVTTEALKIDNSGTATLGVLLPGDAYCIYQGNIDLYAYQLPQNKVTRQGIDYIVESVASPSSKRYVIALKRVR